MRTLLRFAMSGCLSTGVDLVVYLLLGHMGMPWEPAKFISVFLSASVSFFINRKWTFHFQDRTNWKLIVRYVIAQLGNMAANTAGNAVALRVAGNVYVAFVVATGCGFAVNFILQRYFVFRGGVV